MNLNDLGCGDASALPRCDAELPDNPQCAPNYHFGMLLGVDEFRTEQGFHTGRLRRHQRLLHGSGVVAGYGVALHGAQADELRVAPGLAVDRLGRDLVLDAAQCVSLPAWWEKHQTDAAFADIPDKRHATLDLDLLLDYANCLGSPVPAIAEPCAGNAADVAYARICETVRLTLVRAGTAGARPAGPSHHLLRMWLMLEGAQTDAGGQPKPDDQWLIDRWQALQALPPADQGAARAALLREVLARAAAATPPLAPEPPDTLVADEHWASLTLARLKGLHLTQDATGWQVAVDEIQLGLRDTLLPTAALQALLLADPPAAPPPAGPVVARDGASLSGTTLSLVFSQRLAAASVVPAAFAASEFDAATGWHAFTIGTAVYDESDTAHPTVRLALDRAPTGARVRATVVGSGSAPLLGATLLPAGAPGPDSDGRNLSTTITRG